MAADAMTPDLELEVAAPVLGADTVVGSDRPGRRTHGIKQAGWYVLLSGLSLIVLFPIWMTLVRALSTPIAYIEAGQPVTPVEPQWDVFQRRSEVIEVYGKYFHIRDYMPAPQDLLILQKPAA